MEAAARLVNRPSPPMPAVVQSTLPRVQCQSLRVSMPGDAAEVEARHVARSIVSMPATAAARRPASVVSPPTLHRANPVRGPAFAAPTRPQQTAAKPTSSGGEPLPEAVRQDMESRFGADFSAVRIHRDARATQASNALNAAAFTVGNQIHFGAGQFNPGSGEGRELIAHELTHTIQQGAAPQAQRQIQRSTVPLVVESSTPFVQRLGLGDALDYFADKANIIPGFRMLTLLLGFNPINMRPTDRSAANLLRALIELIPGGAFITQALDNHGVINKAAAWIEQKLATLGDIGGEIVNGLKRFVDSLSWSDIFDLGRVWERAKSIFTAPIARLISFGGTVVVEILNMVKDAILKPLAGLAQGTRGYDLLKAILGKDPITDEPYPPTAENLLGGFMKLIGQEEIWENIKKGNAIARAWAWFQGALNGLMGFVRAIPAKIIATITSLTFQDIVTIAGAFTKIVSAFVNIAVDFVSWGLKQIISLLEIIFSVVAPKVMPYIKKAQATFATIIKNPIGFVGNLVRAGKLGFEMFAGNILTHLKTALIKWLVGPLAEAGVYIPQSFQLMEIIKLVLSVLGLTWQNIRAKLVKIIPDPVLSGLEKTASILVTLVKDGPAAAWEQIKAELTELKDQLIGQVTEMISTEVVKAAVTKLVSMLNPAGAVIQAIIAVWNTVNFFIEKANQIGAVVASFIDSISAIAAGQVAPAAKRVEQTLANTLVVVIGFLAKFAGLGNIPTKLVGIVKKVRQPIDKGLDKIVAWLGKMLQKAKSLFGKKDNDGKQDERTAEQKIDDLKKSVIEGQQIASNKSESKRKRKKSIERLKNKYRLTSIDIVLDQENKTKETVHIRAAINPTYDGSGFVIDKFPPEPTVVIEAIVGAPLSVRPGMERKVLESPSKAGLKGYERAHLLGPGLGTDAPQGIFYAPQDVNRRLQNAGIEQMIREMYAKRYPTAEFKVSLTAVPHAGTEILAKTNYKLYGRFAGEPWAFIFEYTIKVTLGASPTSKVIAGSPADMDAIHRFSAGAAAVMNRRGE